MMYVLCTAVGALFSAIVVSLLMTDRRESSVKEMNDYIEHLEAENQDLKERNKRLKEALHHQ